MINESKVSKSVLEIKDIMRKARIEQFFIKINELVIYLKDQIPFLEEIENDLILLENRHNNLLKDIDQGIVEYKSIEPIRAKINSACLRCIKLIENEVKHFFKRIEEMSSSSVIKENRRIEFELKIDKKYTKALAEKTKDRIKEMLEGYLETKLELSFIKEGSIVIGFSVKHDLVTAKKIKLIEKFKLIENLEEIKFNNQILEEYIEDLNDLNIIEEQFDSSIETSFSDIILRMKELIFELSDQVKDLSENNLKLEEDLKLVLDKKNTLKNKNEVALKEIMKLQSIINDIGNTKTRSSFNKVVEVVINRLDPNEKHTSEIDYLGNHLIDMQTSQSVWIHRHKKLYNIAKPFQYFPAMPYKFGYLDYRGKFNAEHFMLEKDSFSEVFNKIVGITGDIANKEPTEDK